MDNLNLKDPQRVSETMMESTKAAWHALSFSQDTQNAGEEIPHRILLREQCPRSLLLSLEGLHCG